MIKKHCETCRIRMVPQHRTQCHECHLAAQRQERKSKNFYEWYINLSPKWEEKRKAVWERARANNEGKCELCRTNHGYAVHHVTYDRLGDEDLRDLLLLCEECHATLHGRNPSNVANVKRFVEFFDPHQLGI